MVARFWSVVVVALLASCGRTAQTGRPSSAGGSDGSGGTASNAGVSGFGGDLPFACPGSEPPDMPLRPLTDYELRNELLEVGELDPDLEARLPTPSRLFSEDRDSLTAGFIAGQA